MLLGYGDFDLSFAIGGSAGGYAFLTPASGLADGRTGSGTSIQWIGGTQNTSSYVEITVTISSPYDSSTAAQGVIGLCNVQGLPVGTKIVCGSVNQRLVRGERRELNAWMLPFTSGNTAVIRIMNDVNGVASIVASIPFVIGEIFIGRLIQLTAAPAQASGDLVDQTQYTRSAGGQLWQLQRKGWRTVTRAITPYSVYDAKGGALSTIPDGGHTASVIDLQGLRSILSTSRVCALCDLEAASHDASGNTTTSGITFNQAFMQNNWMLARPTAQGLIVPDKFPFWSWTPTFQEAT